MYKSMKNAGVFGIGPLRVRIGLLFVAVSFLSASISAVVTLSAGSGRLTFECCLVLPGRGGLRNCPYSLSLFCDTSSSGRDLCSEIVSGSPDGNDIVSCGSDIVMSWRMSAVTEKFRAELESHSQTSMGGIRQQTLVLCLLLCWTAATLDLVLSLIWI